MKKIILTSLLVFGFATVASAADVIEGGTSTTLGNADFNASAKVTLDVASTVSAFGVAGKHLNSGTTYGLTSNDPIMKKSDTLVDKGTAIVSGDAVTASGTEFVLDSSFAM